MRGLRLQIRRKCGIITSLEGRVFYRVGKQGKGIAFAQSPRCRCDARMDAGYEYMNIQRKISLMASKKTVNDQGV